MYRISPQPIDVCTDKDMILGVGAGKRDAQGSKAVRHFISRYKNIYRQARKAKVFGPGISKQDIVVRIVLGLKEREYRILGQDRYEVPFETAYDKVWMLVRDGNRLLLPEEECATTLDDLPPSPGRTNIVTCFHTMPEPKKYPCAPIEMMDHMDMFLNDVMGDEDEVYDDQIMMDMDLSGVFEDEGHVDCLEDFMPASATTLEAWMFDPLLETADVMLLARVCHAL